MPDLGEFFVPPQVNPIERQCTEIKDSLSWEVFDNLDDLRVAVGKILQELSQELIASMTGWDFIQGRAICSKTLVRWYYYLAPWGNGEAVLVDTGRCTLPWWEFLGD